MYKTTFNITNKQKNKQKKIEDLFTYLERWDNQQ